MDNFKDLFAVIFLPRFILSRIFYYHHFHVFYEEIGTSKNKIYNTLLHVTWCKMCPFRVCSVCGENRKLESCDWWPIYILQCSFKAQSLVNDNKTWEKVIWQRKFCFILQADIYRRVYDVRTHLEEILQQLVKRLVLSQRTEDDLIDVWSCVKTLPNLNPGK
jgi:hypothetical protein